MTEHEERRVRKTFVWLDVAGRKAGTWAFLLNRITGLGLLLYLILHLGVLSLLAMGEMQWDNFIKLARSPLFLALDVVLIFGILYHGLNGIRVALVGMGIGVRWQKGMFWALMGLGFLLLVITGWLVFTS
jgi:succinate dehydrogenase / fumarate reductase cytochrome b subunit